MPERTARTIGLIGGMSWQSSAHYYRVLNEEAARRLGGLSSAPVLLDSLDFAPVEALQRAAKWDEAGLLLAASAARLESAGCAVIGLATNTMHICAPAIEAALKSVRFVHIADPTATALVADGFARVGLLGTRFTLEERFYRDRLAAAGLDVLVPDIGLTDLNAVIYDELCRGIVTERSRRTYLDAIARLAGRGAEAVILGCTEISMLVADGDATVPLYDTTDIHAKALFTAALDA